MANNRLYLVHRPTGKSICLGKRMAQGWYAKGETLSKDINQFFDEVGVEYDGQDDFFLAMEDAANAPSCTDKWVFGPDYKPKFEPTA